ncbi:MAG: substrate-binding domain-containing protein [Ferruginibacter sp.]
MKKLSLPAILFIWLMIFICFSCKHAKQNPVFDDSPIYGTIHISVDESFKPVIDEQIKIYEASFPGTNIIAHYKPEAECLKDLFRDSANRMVIVTRGLTNKEEKFFIDSLKYNPAWDEIASDAIAVLVNNRSNDTLFSLDRLQSQLKGNSNRNQTIIFDGLSATSTVRFIMDSVLRGQNFDTSVVKAARTSKEVIDYVASNENAIGMVGIEWIGNPEDSAQVNLLTKVKIAYVQCASCKDSPYVKPMQTSILTKRYPLVRGLYYILKENYTGLGAGFVSFLKYERGQLIFNRAYLGPVMGFQIRNVRLNNKLPKF